MSVRLHTMLRQSDVEISLRVASALRMIADRRRTMTVCVQCMRPPTRVSHPQL